MGNNKFLIPANSKKSMLYLSFFNLTDLIIFGTGVGLSFIFLIAIRSNDLVTSILILLPALVAAFLVIPIPNHHNIRTFIGNVYSYFAKRRTYFWKGWCNSYVEENK
ncbi:MAG: hypothetical protein PHF21_03905 [Bacilli bacterium]|nr:hypothetical protein [Bacilli bacterium]